MVMITPADMRRITALHMCSRTKLLADPHSACNPLLCLQEKAFSFRLSIG